MVVGMCVSYVDFARYAAIVKNLRGVVAADLEESGVEESIKWLASRFRYRDLGVGPMMVERFGSELQKFLGGKPLRELVFLSCSSSSISSSSPRVSRGCWPRP